MDKRMYGSEINRELPWNSVLPPWNPQIFFHQGLLCENSWPLAYRNYDDVTSQAFRPAGQKEIYFEITRDILTSFRDQKMVSDPSPVRRRNGGNSTSLVSCNFLLAHIQCGRARHMHLLQIRGVNFQQTNVETDQHQFSFLAKRNTDVIGTWLGLCLYWYFAGLHYKVLWLPMHASHILLQRSWSTSDRGFSSCIPAQKYLKPRNRSEDSCSITCISCRISCQSKDHIERRVINSTRKRVVGIHAIKACHTVLLGVLSNTYELFLYSQPDLRPLHPDSRPLTQQAFSFCFDEHGHQHMCIEKSRNSKRILTFWHISCEGGSISSIGRTCMMSTLSHSKPGVHLLLCTSLLPVDHAISLRTCIFLCCARSCRCQAGFSFVLGRFTTMLSACLYRGRDPWTAPYAGASGASEGYGLVSGSSGVGIQVMLRFYAHLGQCEEGDAPMRQVSTHVVHDTVWECMQVHLSVYIYLLLRVHRIVKYAMRKYMFELCASTCVSTQYLPFNM